MLTASVEVKADERVVVCVRSESNHEFKAAWGSVVIANDICESQGTWCVEASVELEAHGGVLKYVH